MLRYQEPNCAELVYLESGLRLETSDTLSSCDELS